MAYGHGACNLLLDAMGGSSNVVKIWAITILVLYFYVINCQRGLIYEGGQQYWELSVGWLR